MVGDKFDTIVNNKIDVHNIDQVNKFCYLGSQINNVS